MSCAAVKDSPKWSGELRVKEKGKKITVRAFLRKTNWQSEIRFVKLRCFQIFLLMIDSKTLERTEVKEIGR